MLTVKQFNKLILLQIYIEQETQEIVLDLSQGTVKFL